MDLPTLLDAAKDLGREVVKDGVLVVYLHLVIRPAIVRGLAIGETLLRKAAPSPEELAQGEAIADAEVPKIPQAVALGVHALEGK